MSSLGGASSSPAHEGRLRELRFACGGASAQKSQLLDLALLCEQLGLDQEAIATYERRLAMGGSGADVWLSLYRGSRLLHRQRGVGVPDLIQAYVRTYQYDPSRLEPLHPLCGIYRRGNEPEMAFSLARLVFETPWPHPSVVGFDEAIYRVLLPSEYALSAYAMGRANQAIPMFRYLLSCSENFEIPSEVLDAARLLGLGDLGLAGPKVSADGIEWPMLGFLKTGWWEVE